MSTQVTNADQIAFWNAKAGSKWVEYQTQLDRQIGGLGDAMLRAAELGAGHRVLDVGCGCGATALQAAEHVGASGTVTGVDVSAPMLARARARARASQGGLSQVNFVEADVQADALGAALYDRVISRFGVMFFTDPVAAFRNIRAAMAPAGRLAFVCWRGADENPWMSEPVNAAARHVALPPAPPADAPGPMAFADPERVRRILDAAGLSRIDIQKHDAPCVIGGGGDLDSCVDFLFNVGPLSRALMSADFNEQSKAAIRASVCDVLRPYLTPTGVVMPCAVWIVTANNA
ncbi:MAG: class I SAM-dependent methyltransferase [Gammaproteobacteria bacterium]|nr:class I SAM-dependent methyltransferase [Gammaproteobacteria bacterium]